MTQRTITIKLTSELLERALTEARSEAGICRTCLVAQALRAADEQREWVCGYSSASLKSDETWTIRFPSELRDLITEFTGLGGKKSLARRWFAQRELEGKEFVLTAVRQ